MYPLIRTDNCTLIIVGSEIIMLAVGPVDSPQNLDLNFKKSRVRFFAEAQPVVSLSKTRYQYVFI